MRKRPAWWRRAQLAATAALALVVVALTGWLLLRPAPPVPGEGTTPGASPVARALGGATSLGGAASGAPSPGPASSSAAASPRPAASSSAGVPVAFVGDGVVPSAAAAGAAPASGAPADWTQLLAQALQSDGHPVSRAVAGADGAGWASRSAGGATFASLVPTVVTPGTRVVVLFGSRNDLGTSSDSAVGAGARAALDAVRAASPRAQVLVVAPPPLAGGVPVALSAQTAVLRRAAQAAGAAFLDPVATGWSLGEGSTANVDGGLRLTLVGEASIAEHVVTPLRPLVAAAG